ncbi:MAG: ribulose 1,5-bisphosphate carboxylase [Balneolaceae bacterium]|nr:MAG: ribulose 1,5-bisphosphate carboxylase [Balneolaceae bacterium]
MKSFIITYRITLLEGEEITGKLEGICYEQSVEMPPDTISDDIRGRIVGRVNDCEQTGPRTYRAAIEWPAANTGFEISQFLNVLYGNISLKPGIQVTGVDWDAFANRPASGDAGTGTGSVISRSADSKSGSGAATSPNSGDRYGGAAGNSSTGAPAGPESGNSLFHGPAFGIDGIRSRLNIPERPLSATALKPMGFTAQQLGDLCYHFALGGIDIIKDDHGLADQPYAPFRERVRMCTDAIRRAADETGRASVYIPNITGSWPDMMNRFETARELGAGGVMISPHITGLAALDKLARLDDGLPVAAHPAFSGTLTMHGDSGFSKAFLYGELWRALGADMVIYPNAGGRFSFSREECLQLNETARRPLAAFRACFPMPGGGIQRHNLPEWVTSYGPDTVYLLGGSLYQHPDGIEAAARQISDILSETR